MAFFPEIITRHPAADLRLDGVESHVAQTEDQQILFMQFTRDVEVPVHSHGAQWGVVLDGEMQLSVEGECKVLRRGDTYFIPAGAKHSARIRGGYADVTLFDERNRYKVKET